MDLSERLVRLGLRRGVISSSSPKPIGPAIENLVSGKEVETEAGPCFYTEESFPLSFAHGSLPLKVLLEQSPQTVVSLTRDECLRDLDFQRTAFIDTETTGLARGTGTYVFLVGVGYFSDSTFRVGQFFMRGLEEEQAMLRGLAEFLGRFEALISFNGRSFDLPLLKTRFTLARMSPGLTDLPHFDLLYPARKLWRARRHSCALSALETEVLGVVRNGTDVPSWQIPTMYADYLRTGDARDITSVFYHNQQDILSMVVLAGYMCQVFANPWTTPSVCSADFYSLGRIYQALSWPKQAERAYNAACDDSTSLEMRDHALHHLSFILKRQKRWLEASELWWEAIENGRQIYPYVELAKYYEWQVKDYPRAGKVTQQALDWLEATPQNSRHHRDRVELCHRLSRLERKMK